MDNIKISNERTWSKHYQQKGQVQASYPEGFLVRLLTSKFPNQVVNNTDYKGKTVLDLSCGYGRNLDFLKDQQFQLYATEITPEIVQGLEDSIDDVDFRVAKANSLPFKDDFFDGIVACNSCYYLEENTCFDDNLNEIHNKIKPSGWFIGSIIKDTHSGLKDATCLEDGSAIIQRDQQHLRNGYRLHYAKSVEHTEQMLTPYFKNITIGEFSDSMLGFQRDLFYFYAEKK
ncbi:MAG: SAM-dependent methyltransferase [Oleiphilaceae bacterium]|jgi:SAM-dependent methyltransferase